MFCVCVIGNSLFLFCSVLFSSVHFFPLILLHLFLLIIYMWVHAHLHANFHSICMRFRPYYFFILLLLCYILAYCKHSINKWKMEKRFQTLTDSKWNRGNVKIFTSGSALSHTFLFGDVAPSCVDLLRIYTTKNKTNELEFYFSIFRSSTLLSFNGEYELVCICAYVFVCLCVRVHV